MEELERQSINVQRESEEKEICQSKISELDQLLKEKERLAYEWYQSLKVMTATNSLSKSIDIKYIKQ